MKCKNKQKMFFENRINDTLRSKPKKGWKSFAISRFT